MQLATPPNTTTPSTQSTNSDLGICESDPTQETNTSLPEPLPGFPVCILENPLPRRIRKPRPGDDPKLFIDTRPTRPDDTPLAPAAIRDTYDLPNLYTTKQYTDLVEQHHAANNSDYQGRPDSSPGIMTIYDQITPDIDTPEYKQRPQRLRSAFRQSLQSLPQLPALRTLNDFEAQAILLCRYLQAYPELIQIIGDVRLFCCTGQPDYMQTYEQPHARAGNYITPDPCEEDPASINLYLQRARKKTAINMNRMLDQELSGREVDPDRVRNLLALAATQKYIKQSNPLTGNGPGRPLEPFGKTLTRAQQVPSNHGGRRIAAGRKHKPRPGDENNEIETEQ